MAGNREIEKSKYREIVKSREIGKSRNQLTHTTWSLLACHLLPYRLLQGMFELRYRRKSSPPSSEWRWCLISSVRVELDRHHPGRGWC